MIRLVFQNCGSRIAVGIKGDNETEITYQFNSFWNHEATNGEFQWVIHGTYGYFWTDEMRLVRAMVLAAMNELINGDLSPFRRKKGGVLNEAWKLAEERLDSMVPEPILEQVPIIEPYRLHESEYWDGLRKPLPIHEYDY